MPPAAAETQPALRLRGVVKHYGDVKAVDGLDLDLPMGTCVGLLGPNGAGKSTTMKMLTAQAIADEGEIEVLGLRLPEESKPARAQCGVVPQLDNLDTTLTVEENLVVFSHLYRVPRAERKAAVDRAVGIARLDDRRGAKVDELSGGMRRRLLIARALIHRPRLLLMDEPDRRAGPPGAPGAVGADRAAAQRGHLDPDVHALHRGGRAAGRHRDDHVARQGGGHRIAARPDHASTPAPRPWRSTARRTSWPRPSAPPRRRGCPRAAPARRWRCWRWTGRTNGNVPDGVRRTANLEDVFVLLTGEEIG